MLFPHQQEVFDSLVETAEILFSGSWRTLPLQPRFARLLAGTSGAGKSHVVKSVAAELGLPALAQDATNWIPIGASDKGAKQTWTDIISFLRQHERGIIFLDEIDKVGRTNGPNNCSWLQFVRVEIFAVLDRRVPAGLFAAAEDMSAAEAQLVRDRLKNSMMLVGAGAFQEFWEARQKPTVGFVTDQTAGPLIQQKNVATYIATEIVNRFESPVLSFRPFSAQDYEAMLSRLVGKLPPKLAKHALELGRAGIPAAVESQLGVRWLEQIVYRALALERTKPERAESAERGKNSVEQIIAAAFRPARKPGK